MIFQSYEISISTVFLFYESKELILIIIHGSIEKSKGHKITIRSLD
jgi:hypothetical protein